MKKTEAEKTIYRVAQELFIPANSPRHAARIAKGLQQMREGEMPTQYMVSEAYPTHTSFFLVDLAKEKGQDGYCVEVPACSPKK